MSLVSHKRTSAGPRPRAESPDSTAAAGGIACRLAVPVAWRALDGAPTADFLAAHEETNRRVLGRLIDAFDLAATEIAEEEEAALAPLHHKLNLLIEMIGRTCYGSPAELPPLIRVELGLTQLSWTDTRGASPSGWLTASLFIHPIVLEPLVLCGEVAASEPVDGGFRTVLRLSPMSAASEDLLGRFVFLENRRNVSFERSSLYDVKAGSQTRRVAGLRRIEVVR